VNYDEMDGNRLRLPANRNCYRLSRVSRALLKFLVFKDKIGCRLTRASNAETQLLGYIAWQWDRYLVPQNVFLVYKYI